MFVGSAAVVSAVDERKRTPLHYACQGGHTLCCEFLLQNGASHEHDLDADSCAPIDLAMIANQTATLELLLRK